MQRFFVWAFVDRRTGRVTIAQAPNLPLWLAIGVYALGALIDPTSLIGRALAVAGPVFLALWAGDEILRGVNPWRRALGAGVLLYLLFTLLR